MPRRGSQQYCQAGKRGSTVYGDSAFTLYAVEGLLREACGINLSPMRRKNSRRPASGITSVTTSRLAKLQKTIRLPFN
jgi:hypothetical protein